MAEPSCHTCLRLQKVSNCINWCFTCEESLCTECSQYHFALKATMHHKLVPIQAYEKLSPHLSDVKTTCEFHADHNILYFCDDHGISCCEQCKKDHQSCSLKDIADMLKDDNIKNALESLNENASTVIGQFNKLSMYTKDNISQLSTEEAECYKKLEAKKQEMVNALNEMCLKVKSGTEIAFENERSLLNRQLNEYCSDFQSARSVQLAIGCLTEIGVIDCRMFLLYEKLKAVNKTNSHQVEDKYKSYRRVTSNFDVFTELNSVENTVKLSANITFQSHNSQSDLDIKEEKAADFLNKDEEYASSCVEDEDDVSGKIKKPAESPGDPKTLKVERKVSTPMEKEEICFVRVLPNGKLVIGRKSSVKLIIYETEHLQEVGEVALQFGPSSCDVVDNTEVVVTCFKAIIFVNTTDNTIVRDKMIFLGEECNAIAVSDRKTIVCCKKSVIEIMTISGKTLKTIKNINSPIQMCALEDKSVAIIEKDSTWIKLLNLDNFTMTDIQLLDGIHGRKLMSLHKTKGLYIKAETDTGCKLYKIDLLSKKCILKYSLVGISQTSGFAFDETFLKWFVVENNGKAVCIFKDGTY